jgi:tetratricopeptide (TPR) repeat protein
MSLLIKALASAEKDKQAELNKKVGNERSVEFSPALELASIEASTQVETAQPLQLSVTEAPQAKAVESSALSLAPDSFGDERVSLEAEAGLSAKNTANNLHVKPEAPVNKAKVKDSGSKAQPQNIAATISAAYASPDNINHQKAASVFVANQAAKAPSSKSALVILGVAGALMIWLGLQGYQYISALTAPEVVIVKPAPLTPQIADVQMTVASDASAVADGSVMNATAEVAPIQSQNTLQTDAVKATRAVETEAVFSESDSTVVAERALTKKTLNQPSKNAQQSNGSHAESVDDEVQSQGSSLDNAKRAPIKLVSKTPAAGVDPTLLAAYQAFSRGEDANAQQQYRQVLQRDVRNVDALLGMAAIAQRQGRDADAAGWYQEVLGVEPRNTIAQSAVVRLQVNTDVVGSESRIKNLLAQQPESANLHAALGNLYAEQNQWASAQAAYFNASRFAPNSADYAFNLAISLDQLGKSNLALAQYQRALELLNSSGGSSPDRAQLEARINALR